MKELTRREKTMSKIYVASSWRNQIQPFVVHALRKENHEVYDFRNPPHSTGFHWSSIDRDWKNWTPEIYRNNLFNPIAEEGYKSDYDAMQWADIFVGVQPFGRSASMEMGWAAGQGKVTILLLQSGEPELMVKMFDFLCIDIEEVIDYIKLIEGKAIGDDGELRYGFSPDEDAFIVFKKTASGYRRVDRFEDERAAQKFIETIIRQRENKKRTP
jgi:hypothetical protein